MHVRLKPVERMLFRSELALAAEFRCRPDEPLFYDSGPSNANCIVFPSTSTWIIRPDRAPLLENPTAITLLNRGEVYRREAITGEGSRASWYTLNDETLEEILFDACHSIPFTTAQIPAPAGTILEQRCLFARMHRHGASDALAVEEGLVRLTRKIFGVAERANGRQVSDPIVRRATEYLAVNFAGPLSLAELARQVGASPSYLSRTFHAATGVTMNAFRQRLRLIASLDLLPDYAGKVTDLALSLGYSSHSHFTSCFRAMFEVQPTTFLHDVA